MKKIILSFMTLLVFGTASTVSAQEFNVAAKHAIAVEATTGKIPVSYTHLTLPTKLEV